MLNTYWEYAGTRYKQKLRAIEASRGDVLNISFHGFTSFQSADWSLEPSQSFEELMLARALQLRDTYAYLKLWYSGGTDSHTVLSVFLENNIHLDEIIVYRMAPNSDFDGNAAEYEINTFTLPYLKSLQSVIPKTKITIYELGKDYYDEYLGEKWLHTKNNLFARHYHFPKFKGKNFCHILADCDPDISFENGKFYETLWDSTNIGEISSYRNIELFFTDDSMPDLHIKQCHVMKKFYKNLGVDINRFTIQEHKVHLRKQLRRKPVVIEPKIFKRFDNSAFYGISGPKEQYQYNDMTKEQKEKLKFQLTTKIGGFPLHRLIRGYYCGKYCLGE